MKQDIIDSLPDILKNNIDTLQNTSSDTDNNYYMTDSELTVINFDNTAKSYKEEKYLSYLPASNDGLYIADSSHLYFLEFKNGKIDEDNIKTKIYDSLFILSDIKYNDGHKYINSIVEFSKSSIEYILIYNIKKHGKLSFNNHFQQRANKKTKLYGGVLKLKVFLLKDINFYSENEFKNKFVNKFDK